LNKMQKEERGFKKLFGRIEIKLKDVFLWISLGSVLIFAAWYIFHTEDKSDVVAVTMTEAEAKVSRLLEEIEGVGDASVIVNETADGIQNVVVVCEGAKDLRVIMDVRGAVAAAFGIHQNNIEIYLKKGE